MVLLMMLWNGIFGNENGGMDEHGRRGKDRTFVCIALA